MDLSDLSKLKVVELRYELCSRGLDTKGIKAVLIERLEQALEEESKRDDNVLEDTQEDDSPERGKQEEEGKEEKKEEEGENELDTEANESENKDHEMEDKNIDIPEKEDLKDESETEALVPEEEENIAEEKEMEPTLAEEVQVKEEPEEVQQSEASEVKQEPISSEAFVQEVQEKNSKIDESIVKQEILEDQDENMETDTLKKDHYEADVKQEPVEQQIKEEKIKTEDNSNSRYNDRKRKRSRSRSPSEERQKYTKMTRDNEPEIDDNIVQLSWYDSDLNMIINPETFMVASPLSEQGFGYIWAGVRANYGFNNGKVCFEIKLLENNDVSHLEDEQNPNVLRVGWSILSSGMLLGEEPFSYGFGGTGKAATNCNFVNYGKPFVVGDVVTAYLDYGESEITLSFSVNGEWQQEAYSLSHSTFDGQALFPHVLSKNVKFEINFGQNDPSFPSLPEYTWAAHVDPEKRVAGPKRPETRGECEMLMMCGLPGCGKTYWANEWASKYPEKFYNIIGTNNLIDKMKIQGLPRKRNYHGRWDLLIEKCMKCLNKLLDMANKRRRNYILDQTNVYPNAQKRKMRNFGGFVRRAIVIVPNEEEFNRRVAKREAEEGKDVPDSAVMEMKANFKLPERGECFDEVVYTELNEEEAKVIVEKFNKEAKDAGFGQQRSLSGSGGRGNKRFRSNDRSSWSGGGKFRGNNRGDQRGGWQPDWRDRKPGGFKQGRDDRDRQWRGGRDNFRGRDNYGGGRDHYGGGRDNYSRDSYGRGNYGGGRDNYGGGRDNFGGGRDKFRGGRDDRSKSFDRNRRDGPPNRNARDNKNRGGGNAGNNQGSVANTTPKQGASTWGTQGYDQGWGQNQNYGQTWGQNFQQGWKGAEAQQPQAFNNYAAQNQFNQYGVNQYQGWNQGTAAAAGYAYPAQGMNTYGYQQYPAPQGQGK
uniref:SAP domain-containing protein n=1 Tax=Clastoptera arizonana TaxID=38151 RepID=A0A1B6DK31_9HEMI